MFRRAEELIGYKIRATDDDIGTANDFYFSDDSWTIRYMVVDTGPWLFGRRVLISPAAFETPVWEQEMFPVNLTKQQVENSPNIDLHKPVSAQQQELALHDYYQWRYYWAAAPSAAGYPVAGGVVPMPAPSEEEIRQQQRAAYEAQTGDPHLRSIGEVTGYHIQATDGEIGHVEDFFISDATWTIRYMLVDTRNWLPGRKVLVSPDRIRLVNWHESNVHVDVTREQVESSPEYDPVQAPSRDYESLLFHHYDLPFYW